MYPPVKPLDIGIKLGDVSHTSAPTFDYIIVWGKLNSHHVNTHFWSAWLGGTAGCHLTSCLSKGPNVTVLLIKHGSLADTWANGVPLISLDILEKDSIVRPLNSLLQVHGSHHIIPLMWDQALGGTSCVNAMIYMCGVPAGFNLVRYGLSRLELWEDAAIFHQVKNHPQPPRVDFSGVRTVCFLLFQSPLCWAMFKSVGEPDLFSYNMAHPSTIYSLLWEFFSNWESIVLKKPQKPWEFCSILTAMIPLCYLSAACHWHSHRLKYEARLDLFSFYPTIYSLFLPELSQG